VSYFHYLLVSIPPDEHGATQPTELYGITNTDPTLILFTFEILFAEAIAAMVCVLGGEELLIIALSDYAFSQ